MLPRGSWWQLKKSEIMIHQKMFRVVKRRKRKSTEGEKRAKPKKKKIWQNIIQPDLATHQKCKWENKKNQKPSIYSWLPTYWNLSLKF